MKTTKEKISEILLELDYDFSILRNKYIDKLLPLLEENNWNVWLYSLQKEIENLESLMFFYAWIHDWINWKINKPIWNWYSQPWSMKRKVRKLLWYSIP